MIVDRNKFKEMVAKNAKEIAAKTSEQSVRRMDETVKEVIAQSAAEVSSLLTLISGVIQTEQETMKESMKRVWEQTEASNDEKSLKIRKDALDKALESQHATLQRIFDLVIAKKSNMKHFEFNHDDNDDETSDPLPEATSSQN